MSSSVKGQSAEGILIRWETSAGNPGEDSPRRRPERCRTRLGAVNVRDE